jgi:hypothetical protein
MPKANGTANKGAKFGFFFPLTLSILPAQYLRKAASVKPEG